MTTAPCAFEERMIDEGFDDEQEFMEHLMSEADDYQGGAYQSDDEEWSEDPDDYDGDAGLGDDGPEDDLDEEA